MFILILTFLYSVAVFEEYMFLFTARPNLICPAYLCLWNGKSSCSCSRFVLLSVM